MAGENLFKGLPARTQRIVATNPMFSDYGGRISSVELHCYDADDEFLEHVVVRFSEDAYLPTWDEIQSLAHRINHGGIKRS